MAKFPTHHLAIYNLEKHIVESIESNSDEKEYRKRLPLFELQCAGYGYHLGWRVYDSTENPFTWEAVEKEAENA